MGKANKHPGSRRGPKTRSVPLPRVFALALAITAAVIAWGYLVYLAIDFGTSARSGQGQAWWFLALASVGAVLCLFLGLVLVVRILRALGLTSPPSVAAPPPASANRNADRNERPPGRRRLTR